MTAVRCPVCGAGSLTATALDGPLLAVCDVLVVKALEALGKWVVRADRSRFKLGCPYHVAHTVWTPEEEMVVKALRGAWDVVPALLESYGCCDVSSDRVTAMLDSYVRDLAITGTAHSRAELAYRFDSRLGLVTARS